MFLAGCAFLALQFEKSFTTFIAFFLRQLCRRRPAALSDASLRLTAGLAGAHGWLCRQAA